jgi:flagellar hook-associated protein 3 FlgL
MPVNRVSTLALFNSTRRDMGNVMSTLAELQKQISSGIKADSFKGLNGQVEQFTLLEAKMRRIEQLQQNNQITTARLRTADQSLEQSINIADDMEDLIVLRRSATGQTMNFKQQMDSQIAALTGELNTSFEGRYIFGGTNTANAPMVDPLPQPDNIGVPDTAYYKGSSENFSYRVDERIEIEFPVRADDPAFQKIIAGYHLALEADAANSHEKLGEALELMQQGQADLVAARTRVNNEIINTEQTDTRLNQMRIYLKGVTEQVAKTDTVAAATEIANHEAVLQATFQVYARLSQLRLSDFL